MKSIAFHILKGGVGKTSLSGNIAFKLSAKKKTVLIDCDIQANSSKWFVKDNPVYELADILQGKIEPEKALIRVKDNFYIIPTKHRDSELKQYAETKLFQEPFVFEDLKTELEKLNFKYAIFDLSPSISQLERCILLSVNETISPLTPEYFSYDGIEVFNSEIKKINKAFRRNIKHDKIIVNNINESFSRHKVYLELINKLKSYSIFKVMQDSKIAEAQIYNKSIFEYYPKSKTIPELERITREIM